MVLNGGIQVNFKETYTWSNIISYSSVIPVALDSFPQLEQGHTNHV